MKQIIANSTPAEHAVYWVKDLLARNKVADKVECTSGCDNCCHQAVSIIAFEAVRLAKGLEKLNDSERGDIRSKVVLKVYANNKANSDEDRWKLWMPCSLLIDENALYMNTAR